MKKKIKNHKKKVAMLLIVISFIAISIYFISPKEVEFKDVSFKESLGDYTTESIPYELHFSIVNKKFKPVNSTLLFSSTQDGKTNETDYMIGIVPQRTKLKYKIPFNMSMGNTSVKVLHECNNK